MARNADRDARTTVRRQRRTPIPAPIASKTYGTLSADQQKEMSGLEFVRGLVDGTLPLNMIAQTLGYDVIEVEKGRVVVTVEPREAHLNPYGTVHGGLTAIHKYFGNECQVVGIIHLRELPQQLG